MRQNTEAHMNFTILKAFLSHRIAAKTMTGVNGNKMYECPEERLIEILKEYNRIKE